GRDHRDGAKPALPAERRERAGFAARPERARFHRTRLGIGAVDANEEVASPVRCRVDERAKPAVGKTERREPPPLEPPDAHDQRGRSAGSPEFHGDMLPLLVSREYEDAI